MDGPRWAYPPPRLDLLLLRRDVDAIEARRIEAENFRLGLERQGPIRSPWSRRREFRSHELVDQPFRRPDAVVAAVKELVGPEPEQQFGHHMAEITGAVWMKGSATASPP